MHVPQNFQPFRVSAALLYVHTTPEMQGSETTYM
jgi:hypothetical protein